MATAYKAYGSIVDNKQNILFLYKTS